MEPFCVLSKRALAAGFGRRSGPRGLLGYGAALPAELAEWLQALAASPAAALFRSSTVAYATLNAAHILAIALLVGSIATLDIRVLGLFRHVPITALAEPLSRVAAFGVLLAVATGFLLFSVRPLAYAQNPAFLAKISL